MKTRHQATKPLTTVKPAHKPVKNAAVYRGENSKAEKVRFYSLVLLLILSLTLAWFISSGVSQTLADQFN